LNIFGVTKCQKLQDFCEGKLGHLLQQDGSGHPQGGLPPQDSGHKMKGFGWDSPILKLCHPGGDWHSGGVDPSHNSKK